MVVEAAAGRCRSFEEFRKGSNKRSDGPLWNRPVAYKDDPGVMLRRTVPFDQQEMKIPDVVSDQGSFFGSSKCQELVVSGASHLDFLDGGDIVTLLPKLSRHGRVDVFIEQEHPRWELHERCRLDL